MVARVVPALTTITLWPEPEPGPGFIHQPRLEPEQVRVNISNVSMFIISAPEIQPILSILFTYETYRITKFSVQERVLLNAMVSIVRTVTVRITVQ